ncbi:MULTISPECIES: sporulation-delaying protein SdpB family protein [unclassified Curtobacterium]|uniref:sporulation-delaying protein SdpB family protein n=1 Tax=unclassified Curtobacterium TaxID=257496 RepID=UPI00380E5878
MTPIRDLHAAFNALAANLERFDGQSVRPQVGRSIIALAQLMTLALTTWPNLTADVLGRTAEGYCAGPRSISLFCLGSAAPQESGRWIAMVVCALVISGVYPRWTSILQAWVAISMAVSLSLPDGGEAVAVFSCALLIGVLLPNGKTFGWGRSAPAERPVLIAVGYAASLALCLQIAGIYFESGLAKLAVADWSNGSAMYYIVRDPMFGGVGPLGSVLAAVTANPLGSAVLTWGTILAECSIAVAFLLPHRFKRYGLLGVIVLHAGIALIMGLWSFALVMVGTAVVASYDLRPRDGRDDAELEVDTDVARERSTA